MSAVFCRRGHAEHADSAQPVDHVRGMSACRSICAASSSASRNCAQVAQRLDPTRSVAPSGIRGYGITQSDTKCPAKSPLRSQAPAAPQKAVPRPAEFLSVSARSVYSWSIKRRGRRILAVRARVSNQAPRIALCNHKRQQCEFNAPVEASRSAASLARATFGADAAGAGADDFVAAAMRTGDVHEHVAERFMRRDRHDCGRFRQMLRLFPRLAHGS